MLNAEKYKEKIKELNYRFAVCHGEIQPCEDLNCYTCAFYAAPRSCMENMNKWLLEEYKEPILNDSEKIILRDIVRAFEQFGYEIKYIGRYPWSEEGSNFYLSFQDEHYNELISPTIYNKASKMFKGMELEKDYTLEELGLNDA